MTRNQLLAVLLDGFYREHRLPVLTPEELRASDFATREQKEWLGCFIDARDNESCPLDHLVTK